MGILLETEVTEWDICVQRVCVMWDEKAMREAPGTPNFKMEVEREIPEETERDQPVL